MEEHQKARWKQRLTGYERALKSLEQALEGETGDYSELERDGVIQRFEFSFELAWKVLQDYLIAQGYGNIKGPKPVIRQAFKDGYIQEGNAWMDMLEARQLSTHTYDKGTAGEIFREINTIYYPQLMQLYERLSEEASGE